MVNIVGHKGCGFSRTENTISSFERAIEIGCDRTEMDIQVTKDNVAIVFHDEEVSRLTDGTGRVSDMTLKDIKSLNYINTTDTIPTLQEVIDICSGKILLQIELKSKKSPKATLELLDRNNVNLSDLVMTSFQEGLLKESKELNPNIKAGLLFSHSLDKVRKLYEEIPLDFIGPKSDIITEDMIDYYHGIGKGIYVFRVNDPIRGEEIINMGVDEIGTDIPEEFISKTLSSL